jgi:hypothetical protein
MRECGTIFGWFLLFLIFDVYFFDHKVEILIELFQLVFECLVLFALFLDEFEPEMIRKLHVRDFSLISFDSFLYSIDICKLLRTELSFGLTEFFNDSALLSCCKLVHCSFLFYKMLFIRGDSFIIQS